MFISLTKRFKVLLTVFLVFVIAGSGVWYIFRPKSSADTAYGSISGRVIDQKTENPIPNTEIQISNPATLGRTKIIINTDTKGEFEKTGLASDSGYNIIITKANNLPTAKLQDTRVTVSVELNKNIDILWKLIDSTS